MRKRLGDFLPLILVVVGLGILLYPTVSNFLVERNASRVISNYDAAVASLTEEEYAQMLDDAHAYNSKVAALAGVQPTDGGIDVSGISAETLRQEYNGLLNLNGDGMMGYLTIPSLDVTMPIYHTVEEPVLQVGAGHVETSSLPVGGPSTHSVLSGHRGLPSAKLFTELDKLAAGDQFYIRVLNETFAYEVDSILTVLPHETESLAIAEGEDLCTLVTCTPYAINSHRLLVRGHAIPYEESMDEAVGKTGSFINIPLPYALLMLALAIIAVVLIVLKVRSNKARAAMQAASVSGVVSSRSYEELSRSAYERRGSHGYPGHPAAQAPPEPLGAQVPPVHPGVQVPERSDARVPYGGPNTPGRHAAPGSYAPYRATQVNSPHERKGGAHAKRRNH